LFGKSGRFSGKDALRLQAGHLTIKEQQETSKNGRKQGATIAGNF